MSRHCCASVGPSVGGVAAMLVNTDQPEMLAGLIERVAFHNS
jgi:hypothetical protein